MEYSVLAYCGWPSKETIASQLAACMLTCMVRRHGNSQLHPASSDPFLRPPLWCLWLGPVHCTMLVCESLAVTQLSACLMFICSPVLCRSSMGMYGSYFFIFIRAIVCIIWYGYVTPFTIMFPWRILSLTKILEFRRTMADRSCPSCSDAFSAAAGKTSGTR